jgi:hypothetical protein
MQYSSTVLEGSQHRRCKGKQSWRQRVSNMRFDSRHTFEEVEDGLVIHSLKLS